MVIKTTIVLLFIYEKISFTFGLLFLFIYLGFQLLHIFLENYIWRKWKKHFSIIYQFISSFLYVIATFILSILISEILNFE